jgi:hypothetical protein
MQLILIKVGEDNISVIDIPHDSDGTFLAQMVQLELSIPINEQELEHEGTQIQDQQLAALGIVDGSSISVKRVTRARVSIYNLPHNIAPEELLALVQANPHLLQQYSSADPSMGNVLATGDLVQLRMFIMKRHMANHKVFYTQDQEDKALEADPNNPELQAKVSERVSFYFSVLTLC